MNLRDYKPKGYNALNIGRMHKIEGDGIACSKYIPKYYTNGFTDNWDVVTCKLCRKKRP